MDDLEQQIRTLVDDRNRGVEPVGVDEVLSQASDAPLATTDRSRRFAAAALAAAALVIVAGIAVAIRSASDDDTVRAGTTTTPAVGEWRHYQEPTLGWTLDRPATWTAQSWTGLCKVDESGSMISNLDRPVQRQPIEDGCTTAWYPGDLARHGFVGLSIHHYTGGPPPGPSSTTTVPDTPPGLTLDDLHEVADATGTPKPRSVGVIIDGDQKYGVTAWIADDADPADVERLRHMIESISWTDDGKRALGEPDDLVDATGQPNASTFLVCMRDRGYHPTMQLDEAAGSTGDGPSARIVWGEGDEARPTFDADRTACTATGQETADRFARMFAPWADGSGPSQSPAEAERDGVVPDVAALPLWQRAVAGRWTDTPEGTWAITTLSTAADAVDRCDGDQPGRYGRDYICVGEYGEVLLVDPDDGRVIRAYPLPGLKPTWMRITDDAVFVGRMGDGGLPDSMIVRIDRQTLEARTLLFPSDVEHAEHPPDDGSLDPVAMGWEIAPAAARAQQLWGQGGAEYSDYGEVVDSTVGLTTIDLDAIEQLFA